LWVEVTERKGHADIVKVLIDKVILEIKINASSTGHS
jgi:hypothetical protein